MSRRHPVQLRPLLLLAFLVTVPGFLNLPQSVAGAGYPGSGGGTLGKREMMARMAQVQAEIATDATSWQGFDQLPAPVQKNLVERGGLEPLAAAIGRPNVRANNPTGDVARDVQCQVTVAASGPNVVAVWLDSKAFTTLGSFAGYAWSCDYGQSFTDGGELPVPAVGGRPSYSVVASDGNGTFYLLVDVYNSADDTDRLFFYRGTLESCTLSWTDEEVLAASGGGVYYSFIAVAADPADSYVYAAWAHDVAGGGRDIEVRASADGGLNWGGLSIAGRDDGGSKQNYDYPRMVVGPGNDLYISWTNGDGEFHWCDLGNAYLGHQVYLNRSDDNAASWVKDARETLGQTHVRSFYSNYHNSGPGDNWSWAPVTPSLAVDRSGGAYSGRVYLTWPEPAPWDALLWSGVTTSESESNNTPATATSITLGDDVTGVGATAGSDPDYFQLALTAGETIYLQLEPQGTAGCFAGTPYTFQLRLYPTPTNPNATPDAILASSQGNSWISRIIFTPRWSGTYYLRALLVNTSDLSIPYRIKTRTMAGFFHLPNAVYPMRDEGDIVCITSSDGGMIWSNRVLVNHDAPVGYAENRPMAVVNSEGRVCLFWHDMRETPVSPPTGTGILTDIYMAESTDGGATWSSGRRISDVSGHYAQGTPRMAPDIGRWGVGAATTGRYVYAAWPDGRNPNTTGGNPLIASGVDVYSNILDYEPPVAEITSGPTEGGGQGCWNAEFGWTGTDAITPTPALLYAWKLDFGDYSPWDSGVTVSLTNLSQGSHSFSVKARDAFGNESAPDTRTFEILATPPDPDLAILPTVTGQCAAEITGPPPTAKDACSASVTGTTTDPTAYATQGTFDVDWVYDDGHGNTSIQVQQVVVDDTVAPVPDEAALATVSGICSATITVAPTATDACSGVITGTTSDPLTYSAPGTYVVHWSYDDGHGNVVGQEQTVEVLDSDLQITTSPVPATGCPGGTVVLTVDASSALTMTYQWKKGDTALMDGPTAWGSVISGSVGQMLTISGISAFDVGSYACLVSDACGTVPSAPAAVAVECTVPTPSGSGVTVTLGPHLSLTFGDVSNAGNTSVVASTTGPPVPDGSTVVSDFIDLSTTTTFSGSIEVCLTYDPARVLGTPQLLHWNGLSWTDITTAAPIGSSNTVCGVTSSLSPFVVVESDNEITPGPAPSCISQANTCITIPVRIDRGSSSPAVRGFSVQVSLSANLALCPPGIVEGTYLTAANPVTAFQVVGAASPYTVDGAILGLPCGATATTGDLFYINVARVGPLTGTGTITLSATLLRDCSNAPIVASPGAPLSITIDAASPVAVTNLASSQVKSGNGTDGTTAITLTFTPPGDAAVVEVYRAPWGGYPEYDDAGFAAPPAVPGYPPAGPWVLTGVTASGQTDEPVLRDFWHYVIFTKDGCGNVSGVSNRAGGTLNYHLGDTHNGVSDCAGNNLVDTGDMSFLGANYGAILGYPDARACLDVGPTTDFGVDARPTTDNRVQFEDLIVFAMNHGQVSKPRVPHVDIGGGTSLVTLRTQSDGRLLEAVIDLSVGGNLQGVSIDLEYDRAVVRPLDLLSGQLLMQQGAGSVLLSAEPGNVDVALLGPGEAFVGSGELAIQRFEVIGVGDPRIGMSRAEGRDTQNRPANLARGESQILPGAGPSTGLTEAYPNPFRGSQQIRLSLARPGPARLQIFDVTGRLVRTLLDGLAESGERTLTWDGQDASGRTVANGLYLARLESGGRIWTRHLLKAE